MRDLEADMVGAGQTHSSRSDCQVAGTLKKTREVVRPRTGEKADVYKCTECGREVYEWRKKGGDPDNVALEYFSPEGEITFYDEYLY